MIMMSVRWGSGGVISHMSESCMVGFSTGILYHSCTNLPRNPCELGIVYLKLLSWHLKHSRENRHQKEIGDKIKWENAALWFCCSFNVMNMKSSPVQPDSCQNRTESSRASIPIHVVHVTDLWFIVLCKKETGSRGYHNFTVINMV